MGRFTYTQDTEIYPTQKAIAASRPPKCNSVSAVTPVRQQRSRVNETSYHYDVRD
jgi:hypothetical protein